VLRRRTLSLATCLLFAAACSQAPSSRNAQPAAAPRPELTPKSAPSVRPPGGAAKPFVRPHATTSAVGTSHPAAPATTAATPAPPAAAATPTPAIPRLPSDAAPRIVSIAVDKTTVGSGDRVSGTVLTSSNVASVEVRVAGYGVSLDKVGVGRFTLNYTLGNLPFFVRGTYEMRVIARNARGDSAQQTLPITVH
jgi:hypothetical protein